MRSVDEWIGKTDDERPPERVMLRVFDRHNGICHRSGRRIMTGELWECDHVRAICNGGQNRESNLAPILKSKHKEKTAEDVAEKSKTYRMRSKHLGLRRPKYKIQSRGFSSPVREPDR